jgi:hypothetical protein
LWLFCNLAENDLFKLVSIAAPAVGVYVTFYGRDMITTNRLRRWQTMMRFSVNQDLRHPSLVVVDAR